MRQNELAQSLLGQLGDKLERALVGEMPLTGKHPLLQGQQIGPVPDRLNYLQNLKEASKGFVDSPDLDVAI